MIENRAIQSFGGQHGTAAEARSAAFRLHRLWSWFGFGSSSTETGVSVQPQARASRMVLRGLIGGSFWNALLLVALLLSCGCSLVRPAPRVLAVAYHPQNVFVWGSGMPPNIRRVAMLPMSCDPSRPEMLEGREALEPILQDELAKAHRFEIITISPDALKNKTGRSSWSCEDTLPFDLFSWLNEGKGCDAVLFCRLTVFRGYAPLAVGWRMRLVDVRTRATVWAGDEIFDADQPGVRSGARHYQLSTARESCPSGSDEWVIENSPRQFGQYAASRLLASLPGW